VTVRLPDDVMDALKQRAGTEHGRAGGVALYVRRLVYEHLGLEMPEQYGDKRRRVRDGKAGGIEACRQATTLMADGMRRAGFDVDLDPPNDDISYDMCSVIRWGPDRIHELRVAPYSTPSEREPLRPITVRVHLSFPDEHGERRVQFTMLPREVGAVSPWLAALVIVVQRGGIVTQPPVKTDFHMVDRRGYPTDDWRCPPSRPCDYAWTVEADREYRSWEHARERRR
jgi:hypothetical protein